MIEIRAIIPGYAGQRDARARRLADQQVRAWVGERVAAVRDRLPAGLAAEGLEDVLFHCEFGDQHVIRALEDGRLGEAAAIEAIEAADRILLDAVADSETIDAEGLQAFVERLQAGFGTRADAIIALAPERRSYPRH